MKQIRVVSSTINRSEVVYNHSVRSNHHMSLETMVMFMIAVLSTLDLVLSYTIRSSRWVWTRSTSLFDSIIYEQTHMPKRVRYHIANITWPFLKSMCHLYQEYTRTNTQIYVPSVASMCTNKQYIDKCIQ